MEYTSAYFQLRSYQVSSNVVHDAEPDKVDFLKELVYYVRVNKKRQFLLEHNKLSPLNLQATMLLLSSFRIEKASLFKDNEWSIDKLRRPFILWLTSSSLVKRENKS